MQGSISQDTLCQDCGYDVRGLPLEDRCPQCGTSVGRSLRGNYLRYTDPAYGRRLILGVTIILVGLAAAVIGRMGAMFAYVSGHCVAGGIVNVSAGLVGVAGVWLITTRSPGKLDAGWQRNRRWVVRIVPLVGLVYDLIWASLNHRMGVTGQVPYGPVFATLALGMVLLLGEAMRFTFFQQLARRVPDLGLARSTRSVMYGYVVAELAMRASMGMEYLAMGTLPYGETQGSKYDVMSGMSCVMGTSGLVWQIFAIAWVVLLFRYRNRFIAQTRIAKMNWNRPAAMSATRDRVADGR